MVKLISLTTPIGDEVKHLSPEEIIVYIARVSNPKNKLNTQTAPKLLKYCINHGHWSIFEHVFATFEIKTTRAIAAQILRHRSFTFQEFSQRYATVDLNYEPVEARIQDDKNRQNSIKTSDTELLDWFYDAQKKVWDLSYDLYKKALEKKIAKEQARFLLPLNTNTVLYMSGSLRSWIHYVLLRSANGTQKEHALIAQEISRILKLHFPNVWEALEKKT